MNLFYKMNISDFFVKFQYIKNQMQRKTETFFSKSINFMKLYFPTSQKQVNFIIDESQIS